MNKKNKILISGGGTGGHIYPAIAIAKSILEANPDVEILFVGANGKMEMEKVPAAGFKIKGVDIIGFQRKLTIKNLLLPYYILKSFIQVSKIIHEYKPDVVIGTGGYVSFPLLKMAQLKKIPTIIQEQNAFAGLANKLIGKKANLICVAFDNMEKYFPKDKIVITGNPVRKDLIFCQEKKADALNFFKFVSQKKTISVLGGSLGARTINEAIFNHIDFFEKNNIQLIWQTGKSFYIKAQEKVKNYSNIYCKDFIYEMDHVYAASDYVISRAGASTIAELAVTLKPAILIPSPNVTNDHQTKNALALVNKNAALMIQDDLAQSQLIPTIQNLINDSKLAESLSTNIKYFANTDAADNIAKYALKLIKQ